jgi:hypothetical protein
MLHWHFHKNPPLDHILKETLIYSASFYLFQISISILPSHLCLGLPRGHFPWCFPTKILDTFLIPRCVLHVSPLTINYFAFVRRMICTASCSFQSILLGIMFQGSPPCDPLIVALKRKTLVPLRKLTRLERFFNNPVSILATGYHGQSSQF